jgi:DNA-binding CsgD family transcriptional regulator
MSSRSTGSGIMVERECELARIRDVLAQAAQGVGTVTVIESSAGTGRSRLLSAAAAVAAETDAQIMRACGRDAERLFDFGVVLQLFEPRWLAADADEHDHMFRGPARPAQALTGADARTTGAGAFADVFSITHGLYCLTRNLAGSAVADAGTRPLLLLVDDVQRADGASVRFLAYLGNRIRTLPVALVVTARAGEAVTDADAVRALRDTASHRLHPAELSDGGARRVARMRLPDAEPELWDACADASGGNPFLLQAILDELTQAEPAARSATDLLAESVPGPVVDWIAVQLASLPDAARSLAATVAAFGHPPTLALAASTAGLDADEAARAADVLAGMGLLRPGPPLAFRNRLMARAVLSCTPAIERELLLSRAERAVRGPADGRAHREIHSVGESGTGRLKERPPTPDDRVRLAELALESALRGEARTRVTQLGELASSDLAAQHPSAADHAVAPKVARALLLVDELELGLQILADSAPSTPERALSSAICRSWMLYHRGEVMAAMTSAQSAVEAAGDQPQGALQAVRAGCLIQFGQLEVASTILAGAQATGEQPDLDGPVLLEIRAQLALVCNRPHDALADALQAGRSAGIGASQPGLVTWRTTAGLAHLALDEPEPARRLAEEELELARGGGVTRAALRALRLLGRASTGLARLEALEEAVALGADGPIRLEYLHALVDLGAATRQANQRAAARRPLTQALELARELGASAIAERAQQEIAAGAGRRRRQRQTGMEALTPSERRVAVLAAQGHTTRQIAAELFVTPKTVEFHLRHVYRKLGVPSTRADLASVFHGDPAEAPGTS